MLRRSPISEAFCRGASRSHARCQPSVFALSGSVPAAKLPEVSTCQYLTRGDCLDAYDAVHGNDPATLLIRGGSCIIDPLGVVLVERNFADESIRVAELDRRIISARKVRPWGYRTLRLPDIFGLTVDTIPRNAVSFHGPCKNEAGDKATLNRDAELVERERRCLD